MRSDSRSRCLDRHASHSLGPCARGHQCPGLNAVEVLARDDDLELQGLLADAGFATDEYGSGITWMNAQDRPNVRGLPEGFALVDHTRASTRLHPMRRRSGNGVEARLMECSLYDPGLDLAVEAADGPVAGYALFWFDPVTEVGLLEPMRVEGAYRGAALPVPCSPPVSIALRIMGRAD